MNPYGKTGINFKTFNISEKSLHHRRLHVNKLEPSTFLQEDLTWAPFFDKIGGCVLQCCNFISYFISLLVFGTYSKNYLRWVLFIAKLHSELFRFVNLVKETPS